MTWKLLFIVCETTLYLKGINILIISIGEIFIKYLYDLVLFLSEQNSTNDRFIFFITL